MTIDLRVVTVKQLRKLLPLVLGYFGLEILTQHLEKLLEHKYESFNYQSINLSKKYLL